MEIRLRPLVALLAFVALAVLAGVFVVPKLGSLLAGDPQPIPTLPPVVAPEAAATQPAPAAADVPVTYVDDSLLWDWQVTCAPAFRQFLARELAGAYVRSVKITLVDEKPDVNLPFGTGYAAARAKGNCFNSYGDFTCQVTVATGAPGADLDTATAMNTPYTLLDMFKTRGAGVDDPYALRRSWTPAQFAPVLVPGQEAHVWHSACLTLSRVQ